VQFIEVYDFLVKKFWLVAYFDQFNNQELLKVLQNIQ
jgi:hypothetical protein